MGTRRARHDFSFSSSVLRSGAAGVLHARNSGERASERHVSSLTFLTAFDACSDKKIVHRKFAML